MVLVFWSINTAFEKVRYEQSKSNPNTGLDRPRGFQVFEAPRFNLLAPEFF
jgi:hypothetical protein